MNTYFKEVIIMDNNKVRNIAAASIVGVILIPIVVNTGIRVIDATTSFVYYLGNKRAYNKRIRKGLKDGSISVIDGEYYEIVEDVEEA
jgi:hypothetical protein